MMKYTNMKKNQVADLYSSREKAFKRHFLTRDLGGTLHKIGLTEKTSVCFSF